MKDHLLFLDTSDLKRTRLVLIGQNTIWQTSFPANYSLSERFLPEILKFLSRNRLGFKNLAKLAVVVGPGSFSGLRTGLATANALSTALKIPLIGLRPSEVPEDLRKLWHFNGSLRPIHPNYGRAPHITRAKKF